MRHDPARQSVATVKSVDTVGTTQSIKEEEAKLRCESQLLNKQIPINVHPQIMQTLNVGQNGGQSGSYVNPFAAPTAGAPANTFNIQPPLLGELTGFDLGGDLDSDSDFLNLDDSVQRRNKLFKVHDDMSDGEIMPNIGVGDSLGELHPN